MPAIKIPAAQATASVTASASPAIHRHVASTFNSFTTVAIAVAGLCAVTIIAIIATYFIRQAERSRKARKLRPLRLPSMLAEKDAANEGKPSVWAGFKACLKVRFLHCCFSS